MDIFLSRIFLSSSDRDRKIDDKKMKQKTGKGKPTTMTPNTGRATIYVNPAEPTIVVSTPQYEAVGALAEGLDLDIRRNKFQGAVVGASAVVGAIIGYGAVVEMPLLAALYGAAAGVIASTFVSGLVLMFATPKSRILSLHEYFLKQRQASRRSKLAIGAFLANAVLGALFLPFLANSDSPWAFVACILWAMAWVSLCAYAKLMAGGGELQLKCPSCSQSSNVDSDEPRCLACGYSFF